MPRLYDLLPPDVKAKYPPESLDAPAAKVLLDPRLVPAGYDPEKAAMHAARLADMLPQMTQMRTLTNDVRAGQRGEIPTSIGDWRGRLQERGDVEMGLRRPAPAPAPDYQPATAFGRPLPLGSRTTAEMYEDLTPGARAAARLTAGAVQAVPKLVPGRYTTRGLVPPAQNTAEHIQDVAGGLVGFGATAAALEPLMGGALAAGATGALEEGSARERAIRGSTLALTAGGATAAAGKIGGAAPGLMRAAGSQLPGAVGFGAAQPWAEAHMRRLTGEKDYPLPSAADWAKGTGEMLIITGLTHGVGAISEAARRAGASPEVEEHATRVADRLAPPAGITPPEALASKALTKRLGDTLNGKEVWIRLPQGPDNGAVGTVRGVVAYHTPHGETIHLLVDDGSSPVPVPVTFPSVQAATEAIEPVRPRIGEDVPPAELAPGEVEANLPAARAARESERAGYDRDRLPWLEGQIESLEREKPSRGAANYGSWARRLEQMTAERDALRARLPATARPATEAATSPAAGGAPARTTEGDMDGQPVAGGQGGEMKQSQLALPSAEAIAARRATLTDDPNGRFQDLKTPAEFLEEARSDRGLGDEAEAAAAHDLHDYLSRNNVDMDASWSTNGGLDWLRDDLARRSAWYDAHWDLVSQGGEHEGTTSPDPSAPFIPTASSASKPEPAPAIHRDVLEQANSDPGNAALIPAGTAEAFEKLLQDDGWTRQQKGKAVDWVKGNRSLFLRSQGDNAGVIVQWSAEETIVQRGKAGLAAARERFPAGSQVSYKGGIGKVTDVWNDEEGETQVNVAVPPHGYKQRFRPADLQPAGKPARPRVSPPKPAPPEPEPPPPEPPPPAKPEPKPRPAPKPKAEPKAEPKAAEPEAPAEPKEEATLGRGTAGPEEFAGHYTIEQMKKNNADRRFTQFRSPDGKVWTDGHVMVWMDQLADPKDAAKYGPIASGGDGQEYPKYEQVVPKPDKEPLEAIGTIPGDGTNAPFVVLVDKKTGEFRRVVNAWYWNLLKNQLGDGVEIYGAAEKKGTNASKNTALQPVMLMKDGNPAALIMPLRPQGEVDVAAVRKEAAEHRAAIGPEYASAIAKAADRGVLGPDSHKALGAIVKDDARPKDVDLLLRLHREKTDGARLRENWQALKPAIRVINDAKALASKKDRSLQDAEFIERAKRAEKVLLDSSKRFALHGEGENPDEVAQAIARFADQELNPKAPETHAAAPSGQRGGRRGRRFALGAPARLRARPDVPVPGRGVQPPADATGVERAPLPQGVPASEAAVSLKERGAQALEALKKIGHTATKIANPIALVAHRAADVFMRQKGELEHAVWRTQEYQRGWRDYWDGLSREHVMRFLDDFENNRAIAHPKLSLYATELRTRADNLFRALSFYKDLPYWENWFPHLWKDPAKADAFFAARRPLEGNKSFLKPRIYQDIRAGLEAGLALKSWNPEIIMQEAEHNARKFIMVQKLIRLYKKIGFLVYGRAGQKPGEGKIPASGFRTLDQRWAKIYANPVKKVPEYFDAQLMSTLQGVADAIGATTERKTAIGGRMLGYSQATPGSAGRVVTRFATPLSVLAHEIGHAIDSKYGLRNSFLRSTATNRELQALADLRMEGIESQVPASFKGYIRSGPEKMAVMLEALAYVPERFKEVAPYTYEKLMKFFDQHAELAPLKNLKRGLVYGKNMGEVHAGGIVQAGDYWVEENLARILDNHMSRDFVTEDPIGRGIMASRNFLNAIQLGISGFHATGVTLLSVMSRMSVGVTEMGAGKFGSGGRKFIGSLKAPWDYWQAGHQFYLGDPSLSQLERDVFSGGASLRDRVWYQQQAFEAFAKRMHQQQGAWPARLSKAAVRRPDLAAGAAIQGAMHLLTRHYIPQIKIGAFRELMASELERRSAEMQAGTLSRETLAREQWNNIENRFGMLNYDNLFWNRTLKSTIMLAVRAPGWTLGTLREFGGATFIDLPKFAKGLKSGEVNITPRMAFALSMAFTTMAMGGIYAWASTGEPPKDLDDYLEPRTGKVDENGAPIRVSFPTYMKDVRRWATDPVGAAVGRIQHGHGATSLFHGGKLAPEVTMGLDWLENQTYRGPLHNTDDPAYKQAEDVMQWLFHAVEPFSFEQQRELSGAEGTTWRDRVEPFFGITKVSHRAPPALTHSRQGRKAG